MKRNTVQLTLERKEKLQITLREINMRVNEEILNDTQ